MVNRVKNKKDACRIVIVREIWQAGLNVPNLTNTVYADKPIQRCGSMKTKGDARPKVITAELVTR